MTTVSVRLNSEEQEFFNQYSKFKGLSVSTLMKNALAEQIEYEMDIKLYDKAMKAFKKDQTTYTLDEVKKSLGL